MMISARLHRRLMRLSTRNEDTHPDLAYVYAIEAGDEKAAKLALSKMKTPAMRNRDAAEAAYDRAWPQYEAGNNEGAIALVSRAISIQPAPKYFILRMSIYFVTGRVDMAYVDLNEANQLFVADMNFYDANRREFLRHLGVKIPGTLRSTLRTIGPVPDSDRADLPSYHTYLLYAAEPSQNQPRTRNRWESHWPANLDLWAIDVYLGSEDCIVTKDDQTEVPPVNLNQLGRFMNELVISNNHLIIHPPTTADSYTNAEKKLGEALMAVEKEKLDVGYYTFICGFCDANRGVLHQLFMVRPTVLNFINLGCPRELCNWMLTLPSFRHCESLTFEERVDGEASKKRRREGGPRFGRAPLLTLLQSKAGKKVFIPDFMVHGRITAFTDYILEDFKRDKSGHSFSVYIGGFIPPTRTTLNTPMAVRQHYNLMVHSERNAGGFLLYNGNGEELQVLFAVDSRDKRGCYEVVLIRQLAENAGPPNETRVIPCSR